VLASAASFFDFILAIHIFAVVVAFGILFIYPVLGVIGVRLDPRAMPWFHRFQYAVHMRVSAPGLVVIFLAGIYLASKLHAWGDFYVAWGVAVVVIIGGIGGAYISPREKRLAVLAEAEVAVLTGTPAPFDWSPEYLKARREADLARNLQALLAALTILFMALQLGA
jgi:hypothetical protein